MRQTVDGGFEGERTKRGPGRAAIAAFATLVVAPLVAGALAAGTPAALLALPMESIAVVLLLLAIPWDGLRKVVAVGFAVVVVLGTVAAALDLGFEGTIDRPFNLIEDLPAVVSAFGVVRDATGAGNAALILALLIGLLIGAAFLIARAALRAGDVAASRGRAGRVGATVLAITWILCAIAGAQLVPGVPLAAADATAALAATSARTVLSIREDAAFERELASDPLPAQLGDELLTALQGKDVVFAFVESYGKVALQDPAVSPGVLRVLEAGAAQLTADGYTARSAFLTSPTFGGVSWLAHATLQSGVWVDSQRKYDRLTSGDRFTLTQAFEEAGWRTVAVVPSNRRAWPVGTSFYGWDAILDSQNMGYRGPAFSYARIPDQYTWQHFHERELARGHGPVMAEIDLVSSHSPWTPLPRLVPWSDVGDGRVFRPQPAEGLSPVEVWADPERVRTAYRQSVEYALETMFSYLETYDPADLVLVVLGDHQPARIVSGPAADRDVPVSVITKDPAVIDAIASWGWDAAVHPSAEAPVWSMDLFRGRFLEAFSG